MEELIFVGTSSGKTDAIRFHSSLFFRTENYGLLIDAGDGIAKGLLNAGIDFDEIDGVVITHTHADHFAGLASLVTQMIIDGRKKSFQIFIFNDYQKQLLDFLNLAVLFPETFSFDLRIKGFEFGIENNIAGSLSFLARQNSHVVNKRKVETDFPFASASIFLNAGKHGVVYTSDVGNAKDLRLFDDLTYDIFISECEHIKPKDIANFSKTKKDVSFFITHYTDAEEIRRAFSHSSFKIAYDKLKINPNKI
ncbi:MAG: ribonuclease Z [Chlorobi bacterium]|nr:ribonuclease Z [Chlorobiota bacterium]